MKRLLARLTGCAALLASAAAMADGVDMKRGPAPVAASAPSFGIQWDVGGRYWVSTGGYTKDLFLTDHRQVSKLTYDDLTAHAAEAFFRGDHKSGLFVKGIVGGGSITGGKMNDEDWPVIPDVATYSNTLSSQRDGSITYFTFDLGYTFYSNETAGSLKDAPTPWTYRVGGFVGYNYWQERLNTFGCDQLVPAAVDVSCNLLGNNFNGLDNDATWRSLRLGLTGDVMLGGRLKLTGDMAYVTGSADVTDFHNQRPDIRGVREDSSGDGVQIEGILSYQFTELFSMGVGGRYWRLSGDGQAHFEDKGGVAQPVKLESERVGVFVQGSIKLD